ncbi:hypothetical protein [Streptomyces chartreusis]|uniref:Uncharacterized protein n=1 Tax=Streptomyces chartreusis TaxID=1969 RepID=A0A7H8T9V1_STRCX|nr:hypothetical protein [Streptomyces chartreusis]QKZ19772.1 hypothetical protein HUT05_21810 [Streptomyces chartreusis]
MSPQDVLLYTVLLPFFPEPQDVANVAEHLVRTMRVPNVEYRTEWDDAGEVRASARDFRRVVFGLVPMGRVVGEAGSEAESAKEGAQLTIDTRVDTFERAIAAVRAAYGHNIPAPVVDWHEGTSAARPDS